jgi:hypothetical protein
VVIGAWRSLVAHLLWEQGVAGSNPAAPIRGRSAVSKTHIQIQAVDSLNAATRRVVGGLRLRVLVLKTLADVALDISPGLCKTAL